jgi:uncharacterized sporulation protein YeaH/YhbH (DUF444 family)
MGLMPAYFSTTRTGRQKNVRKTAKAIQLEREIAEMKRKAGITGTGRKHKISIPDYNVDSSIPLSNKVGEGVAGKRRENVYSGERKLIGIATLHKSNAVPVFSKEDAEAISKMRRG